MLKSDYGKLGCPFYAEKLDNGLNVYLIPRKSTIKSAVVHISKGTYADTKSISFGKINDGSAYFLANIILDDELKNRLLMDGVLATVEVTSSFTAFRLSTTGDNLFEAISLLLERISSQNYSEDEVNAFRKLDVLRALEDESDSIELSKRFTRKALYFNSPSQNGNLPDSAAINLIHATALKRFQECYYVPKRMALIVSMEEDAKKMVDEVRKLKFPRNVTMKEDKKDIVEDHTKVSQEYIEIKGKGSLSYFTYGIKFPARKDLYTGFGEAMFYYYEPLIDLLFKKNQSFLSNIQDKRAELISATLEESGEDAHILLTFCGDDVKAVCNYMADYLSAPEKRVSSSFFDSYIKDYYANAMQVLASPYSVVEAFSSSLPNHIAYTSLAAHTIRMNYNNFRKFLTELKRFPRSCVYVRKA